MEYILDQGGVSHLPHDIYRAVSGREMSGTWNLQLFGGSWQSSGLGFALQVVEAKTALLNRTEEEDFTRFLIHILIYI